MFFSGDFIICNFAQYETVIMIWNSINYDNFEDVTGITLLEIFELTGMYAACDYITDINVAEISGYYPDVVIKVVTNIASIKMRVNVRERIITNADIKVFEPGGGIGTLIHVAQVYSANKLGYRMIECYAFGNWYENTTEGWSGYIVWGKLGYLMGEFDQILFEAYMEKNGKKATILHELLKTKSGNEFWLKYGFGWYGYFDLNIESTSFQILQRYLKNKPK